MGLATRFIGCHGSTIWARYFEVTLAALGHLRDAGGGSGNTDLVAPGLFVLNNTDRVWFTVSFFTPFVLLVAFFNGAGGT